MTTMKSRDTFSKYIYDLHEHVNNMLKKKSNLSYDDVRERYEHFRARCLVDPKMSNIEKVASPKESKKGCTEPLFGTKSKCLIKIVPINHKTPTFEMNKKCIRTRKNRNKCVVDNSTVL